VHAIDREALVYCHICGNVMPILEDLVETGLDCIGPLDPLGGFTVGEARERVAGRASLMGGVNTLTLLKGTPGQVRAESLHCLEQMKGEPGYILGSGCVVPPRASLENIRAMADATR
jgi:uroporphyrinogen-III decarboxylase